MLILVFIYTHTLTYTHSVHEQQEKRKFAAILLFYLIYDMTIEKYLHGKKMETINFTINSLTFVRSAEVSSTISGKVTRLIIATLFEIV